ncbi:glycoside hydrolase family 3 C-terminal domain-containing protein [Alkalicoccus urumqiensis]|uniref:Glycosyl hydrolase n=1 Tax=Alkalicoccus urumqiensis TaxID=1548213 RepID=A0A2P6MLJ0_ALKUR|nr:glycoside hydrolase family 3 C-terminal domain-containing protein [Alkalicoccus urumqiensis]PRO67138.1 glycosyl hydrolase [Alkalicoccus urumqiensis]
MTVVSAENLVKQMTLEEKAGLCSGASFWETKAVERLDIPSVILTDGPHGLRKQQNEGDNLGLLDSVPATCFPSAAGLAATWNRDLLRDVGAAIGREAAKENVAVVLGPGTNMKRSPLCGRNFEYFSEDPYLSSEMSIAHITGVQEQGVGTSLKHFAVNNQEHRRMTTDAVVDERTLREIYLASFEETVKQAQPWTVMSAYNKVNGTYASESSRLLTDILKKEWGFKGIVVSDWGAVNERVQALQAGLELEMPSSQGEGDKKIISAVQSGALSETVLDEACVRLLDLIFRSQQTEAQDVDFDSHHQLARQAAAESMVLLKNENDVLPLDPSGPAAVIGRLAAYPRYQGGGSSHINPVKLDDPLEELRKYNPDIAYAPGYELESDRMNDTLLEEACAAAEKAGKAVVFAGLPDRFESEGYDRSHLRLPDNQVKLLERLKELQVPVIVVLSNGAPVEMPWLSGVDAVVEGYLGGQAFGGAAADVLYGRANPSGRLAETFPERLEHNPSYGFFPGEGDQVEYREGIFIGYRYYNTKKIKPLFPFGYGLSYTTFSYDSMNVEQVDGDVYVDVTVTNTGDRTGAEVVQIYLSHPESSVVRPEKELKGFEKITLEAGETGTVRIALPEKAFAYYEPEKPGWHVEGGSVLIHAARSVSDIEQTEKVKLSKDVFTKAPAVHRNATIGDLMKDPALKEVLGEELQRLMAGSVFQPSEDEPSDMIEAMMAYMPLRALVSFQPSFTEDRLEELLDKLNGVSRR